MGRRCDRNRKRSKRRAIYCPVHHCYLDSVSQKHAIYSNQPSQLLEYGIGKQASRRILAAQSEVILNNHWLEAFWCEECQKVTWYHIHKIDREYRVSTPPPELWQRVMGVTDPRGNPSVGEFTRKQARMAAHKIKQFGHIY
ncbi:hypothetical protein [Acaryochloris sp. CCMEE 5410]|uniref:hypothetical protein n=1 Tax=Acaryochloris sp. CCMEE 5410 TaxID=310037 RepID=UPI0002484E5A|nr:hypothetical protein [Acaryochloris sp. CCMEE 5410]KAI9130473.1 hypothetical protein ON05_022010 [Acaryochloris sp. CCMEE 5410]